MGGGRGHIGVAVFLVKVYPQGYLVGGGRGHMGMAVFLVKVYPQGSSSGRGRGHMGVVVFLVKVYPQGSSSGRGAWPHGGGCSRYTLRIHLVEGGVATLGWLCSCVHVLDYNTTMNLLALYPAFPRLKIFIAYHMKN